MSANNKLFPKRVQQPFDRPVLVTIGLSSGPCNAGPNAVVHAMCAVTDGTGASLGLGVSFSVWMEQGLLRRNTRTMRLKWDHKF